MKEERYTVGKRLDDGDFSAAQSITFIVTEDCNLRCKYCYITHKASNKRMSFEVAKKFIDYILEEKIKYQDAVTLDFIGGEPFLEVDLIDKICDYFKLQTYLKKSPWYWNYRLSVCTNGINYSSEKVQRFIEKNREKLGVTITIDGIKEKHDLQRVFPDGSGSYDIVKANVDIWKNQFWPSTKVTFASEDLKYLRESIVELWNEGIYEIAANVVYEDVWKEGDDDIFEDQLKSLADYVLDNQLFDKYTCTLFDDSIGAPYDEEMLKQTCCGAGKMLALGVDGKIYPCMRYCAYSLNEKDPYVIGDVEKGIDFDKVRPFETVTYKFQSDSECLECPIATGCGFCQGFNYDVADTYTNFQRAKYICKMHKARVRANNYYFAKLYNMYGIERDSIFYKESRTMNFLLSDDYISCCMGTGNHRRKTDQQIISEEVLLTGLEYAKQNFYKPVFIHSEKGNTFFENDKFNEFRILHIVPIKFYELAKKYYKDIIPVVSETDAVLIDNGIVADNVIFNIEESNIHQLSRYVKALWKTVKRININILGLDNRFDLEEYKKQLQVLKQLIKTEVRKTNIFNKEINVLTDILLLQSHENCGAGDTSITLGVDGKFYVCPAFYSDETEGCIGQLSEWKLDIKNPQLYKGDYFPICQVCDTYQCANCIYHNKKHTSEVNVPAKIQCQKSWVERSISEMLQTELNDVFRFTHKIEPSNIKDPISIIHNTSIGYYPE